MTAEPSFTRHGRRMPTDRLRAALNALAEGHAQIVSHLEKPWASITFAGTRHTLSLVFEGHDAVAAGEDFIAILPEHEFTIPGQLVADASIAEVEHHLLPVPRLSVQCEILLLEES